MNEIEILSTNFPYLAIFLAALLDSIFLIGFFLYGTLLFVIALTLLNGGDVSIPEIIIFSFLGATIGDTINFYIGYLINQEKVNKLKNRFNKKYEKANTLIEKYGVFAFIIGRFTGPARPMTPLLFGLLKFNPYKAQIFILIACMLWVLFWTAFLVLTNEGINYL